MQIKRIFLGIVIAFTLNSCINTIDGNGEVTKEQRAVSSFNKIEISGAYEVLINQGNEERLELEVDENLLEHIKTKVKNNTLHIKSKKIGSATSLKLYITVVDVEDIDVSGAVELKNKGTYQAENLEIDVSGAADINLDVDVENLRMDMSGASETTLSGNANNFEIEISGAGELQAKKLKTRNAIVDISGAGSAIVHAKKTLKVEVSGAGSVKYKGSPKIEKEISGAGSVEKI
jgi:Putative auto-transporter adhesin, head GIN domain